MTAGRALRRRGVAAGPSQDARPSQTAGPSRTARPSSTARPSRTPPPPTARAGPAAFDRLADAWDDLEDPATTRGADAAARIAFLRSLCAGAPRVLEVGCGTGVNLVGIADRIASGVGVDFSARMIERARALARRRGVERVRFAIGDATALHAVPAADGPFELILLIGVLEHVPRRGRVLRACRRRLTDDGRLVVVTPHPANPGFLYRRLIQRRDPRIFASDRHFTPGELARAAAWQRLRPVRIHALPFRPTYDDGGVPPPPVQTVLRAIAAIPRPATRGAYAMVLRAEKRRAAGADP